MNVDELYERYEEIYRRHATQKIPKLSKSRFEAYLGKLSEIVSAGTASALAAVLTYASIKENKPYYAVSRLLNVTVFNPQVSSQLRKVAEKYRMEYAMLAAMVAATLAEKYRLDDDREEPRQVAAALATSMAKSPFGAIDMDSLRVLVNDLSNLYRVMSYVRMSEPPQELLKLERRARNTTEYIMRAAKSSTPFGIVKGIRRMRSLSEISDLLPKERALLSLSKYDKTLKPYVAYKLASKDMLVWDKSVRVKPVIFIDWSGSMASHFVIEEAGEVYDMTRRMAADLLAASLVDAFKGGDVFVFTTEITPLTPLFKNYRELVKFLITEPGGLAGGTDISNVLSYIKAYDRAQRKKNIRPFYFVITDAEDNVPIELIESLPESLRQRILFLVMQERVYDWVKRFNHIVAPEEMQLSDYIRRLAKTVVAATSAA